MTTAGSPRSGMSPGQSPEPVRERILVVQTSFLGDVVLTTPLIAELKRRLLKAEIAVLCTPRAQGLLEGNPDLDWIITDDKRGADRGWRGMLGKAREIRSYGFHTAVSPHKSLRTALLLFLAAIPQRIGFRQSAGWFLYHKRVHRDVALHDVDRNLSLLTGLGLHPEESRRTFHVGGSRDSRDKVERLFASLEIGESETVIGIHPGSAWPTKRWSADGYAKLVAQLRKKYHCRILLFGGAEDREIIDRLQQLSGGIGVDLGGKLDLAELSCAIGRCGLFVTNDSGPMHIAVAQGVPVVAVFCATTPSLGFSPYSSRAVVVEKELACRPCSSHGGRRCPLGTEDCIRLVDADHVLRGVEQLLDAPSSGGPGSDHRPLEIKV